MLKICPNCKGKKTLKCPLCGGDGTVAKKVHPLASRFENQIECPHCHGVGKVVCEICGGMGVIDDKTSTENEPTRLKPQLW
jgi:DnaJ-class molecular chaperone